MEKKEIISEVTDEIISIEDIYSESHKKNLKRRVNNTKKKQRHIKMAKSFGTYDVPIMIEKEKDGEKYYTRRWLSHRKNSRASCLKKDSNQRVRQYKDELSSKGNTYKKVFDFWWELS